MPKYFGLFENKVAWDYFLFIFIHCPICGPDIDTNRGPKNRNKVGFPLKTGSARHTRPHALNMTHDVYPSSNICLGMQICCQSLWSMSALTAKTKTPWWRFYSSIFIFIFLNDNQGFWMLLSFICNWGPEIACIIDNTKTMVLSKGLENSRLDYQVPG